MLALDWRLKNMCKIRTLDGNDYLEGLKGRIPKPSFPNHIDLNIIFLMHSSTIMNPLSVMFQKRSKNKNEAEPWGLLN